MHFANVSLWIRRGLYGWSIIQRTPLISLRR